MAKDLVRIESNERIDLTDFELLANTVMGDVQRDQGDQFFCDPGRDRKWVIDGFAMDNPAAKQLRVTLGKAILAYRTAGVIQYGMLATSGDATKTVDLNGWAAATYGIYVRFQYVPGTSQSRIFWDPTGTGTEFAQTINTKFHSNWSLRVESSNPGDEWLKIGEVAQATMTITDQRGLYFEGDVHNSYQSGWSSEGGGIANDRNADRQQYGVTDVQMFTAAMRQCITDIRGRGLKAWYEKGIGGMNIGFDTNPTVDKLAVKDANFHMTGSTTLPKLGFDDKDSFIYTRASNFLSFLINDVDLYRWDANAFWGETAGLDLGKTGNRWDNIFAVTCDLTDHLHVTKAVFPNALFQCTNAAVNQEKWKVGAEADGDFVVMAWNDVEDASSTPIQISRSSEKAEYINFSTAGTAAGEINLLTNRIGLGGNSTASDKIECFQSLVPNGARTLGLTGTRWTTLFLTGSILSSGGGIVCGGTTSPVSGDGIFTTGLVVGYDGTPVADEIRLQNLATRLVGAAGPSLTLYGGAGCYLQINDATDQFLWYANGLSEMLMTTAGLYPTNAEGLTLGAVGNYWATFYGTNLKLFDTVDGGGTNNFTTITGSVADTGNGANGTVALAGGHASSGWLKIYHDAVAAWIPFWDDITT